MSKRPSVKACRGKSPLTGKPVGEHHRWSGAKWGEGRCEFCGRYLEDVLEKAATKRKAAVKPKTPADAPRPTLPVAPPSTAWPFPQRRSHMNTRSKVQPIAVSATRIGHTEKR